MIWNAVKVAFAEVRRNVMRSLLTVLGIVIGVAAVITMVSVGSGATLQITNEIRNLGDNLLIVLPGQRLGPSVDIGNAPFDLDDAEAIAKQVRAVSETAPLSSASVIAVFEAENWSTTVAGITDSFYRVRRWPVVAGRGFTEAEYRSGKAVCIIGNTVRTELFGRAEALGERIRIGKISCEVVGRLETKGQSAMGRDQDDVVLVPMRTFHRRISGNTYVGLIQVSVRDGFATERAKRDIELLLRERRHIEPTEDDNFSVRDMKEIARALSGTTRVLTMLLGAVAAVSLLVGGIGIMNIMLVSVTERTREIGIRLAVGAFERDVLIQFLVEAVVLSSAGGLFGILLALASTMFLADLMQLPFVFNFAPMMLAFTFSVVVGVVFGFVPALRAARLDPIEALRHE